LFIHVYKDIREPVVVMRVGFVVNPYAGLGGAIGSKGTDEKAVARALSLGYQLIAPRRAVEFLRSLRSREFRIVTAAGLMGEDEVAEAGLTELVEKVVGERKGSTTREDTIASATEMLRAGVDIIVFVGGDGTLKDVYSVVGTSLPVLGVPSGVKVYSGAFAYTPRDAAGILEAYLRGSGAIVEAEVVDVDEELFRSDKLSLRVYGYVKTVRVEGLLQPSKGLVTSSDDEENKRAIARYLYETMEDGAYYILGPGSTVKAIGEFLRDDLTQLGVDVVLNRRVVLRDTWERPLLEIVGRGAKTYVVVTPIGRQGFIFGRGNQQISPNVLRLVPRENIIVVATLSKIRELDYLRVYTGDEEVDNKLRGYYRVLVDYGQYMVKKAV